MSLTVVPSMEMKDIIPTILPDTKEAKKRELPAVQHDLHLDLKLGLDSDLEEAIRRLQEERDSRTSRPTDRIHLQFDHIASELEDKIVACQLSMEHLELYRNYMLRFQADKLPQKIERRRTSLLQRIQLKLTNHPLSSATVSGDMSSAAAVSYGKSTRGSSRRRESTSTLGVVVKTPLRRRRQMCAMLGLNFFTGPSIIFVMLVTFMYFAWPYSMYVALGYFSLVFLDNYFRPHPRPATQLWRNHGIFRLFRNYFPVRLVKSLAAERNECFDPKKNYLFCYHPHGVQSAGAFIMSTGASGFDELFPGLSVSVQTLSINFKVPVFRENCIGLGMGDASKECITNALTRGPGSCAALVTGGAKESMHAQPYSSKVVLRDRAGFVKLALRTGALLVPMWGFGENNLYENLAIGHPFIQKWQRRIQRLVTFAPLLVQGRGVFSYSSGLVPHRRPITTVVGSPIDMGPPDPHPSREKVQKYHEMYKKAVVELFNNYREIYDPKAGDVEFI